MNRKYPHGKYVFLTGGSSGVGLKTAQLFAENGFIVYSASRNPNPEARPCPGGGEIRPVRMDVRDASSVENAARAVLSEADIGIVVHSAGIGIACPAEEYPHKAVASLMDTNYNGVLLVNSHFLPHLRRRGGGLCLIVGSVAGIFPIPFQSHYCSSKAALGSYAAALRMELRPHRVNVSLVLPGDTNTGFTAARTYEIEEASPYYEICKKAVGKIEKDELKGRAPDSAAAAMLRLGRKRNPPLRKIIGFEYKLLAFISRFLPDRLIEKILRSMYMEG